MRVVGDNVGQPQVLPIRDALKLADELELDLIEISPKAEPPYAASTITRNSFTSKRRKPRN